MVKKEEEESEKEESDVASQRLSDIQSLKEMISEVRFGSPINGLRGSELDDLKFDLHGEERSESEDHDDDSDSLNSEESFFEDFSGSDLESSSGSGSEKSFEESGSESDSFESDKNQSFEDDSASFSSESFE